MFSWVVDRLSTLNASAASALALLESPRVARRAVAALLLVHSGLLAYSAYVHSPTLNEPGHLVAGLSHWKFGRFELYRVNPPLVRMIAALPVMAVGYEEDWSGFYEGPGARPVFGMGEDLVAANGERSFFLFMIARWVCFPFSWLGAIVCYLWARDLFGRPAGVMACALWCFEPNILAHASLMTPDAHAAALGAAACYTFWRWLRKPTWAQAALTGVVLGLAELAKTTLIVFYPLWPLMWLAYRWTDRHGMNSRDWLREGGMLLVRMAIGLYVLNLGYGFEGTGTPLNEFHFVSDLFTGNPGAESNTNSQSAADNPPSANRFADTWLGHIPVPFPKNYLLGIDIQQKDFEHYGRPSYLRGEWRETGWWYYYLYAALVKVPLALWLLGLAAVGGPILGVFASRWKDGQVQPGEPCDLSRAPSPSLRDICVLLLPMAVIFVVVSSKTGFSEHFRYVLPCFPMLFVWVSGIARTK
ncbi:MAG: glycosyltransferase family 39 protein [Pirellulales bacterium]|nr:glycosyltransferase family 39 protein [Pirellulales bacterium]